MIEMVDTLNSNAWSDARYDKIDILKTHFLYESTIIQISLKCAYRIDNDSALVEVMYIFEKGNWQFEREYINGWVKNCSNSRYLFIVSIYW